MEELITFLGIMYSLWWKITDFIFNKFQDRAGAFIIIIIIIVESIYANVVPDGKEKKNSTQLRGYKLRFSELRYGHDKAIHTQ